MPGGMLQRIQSPKMEINLMTFKDQILKLAWETNMTNEDIRARLGCSVRTVQHFAGGTLARIKAKQGNINEQLPRVLILDIETSPMEFYGWHLFKQTVMPHQVKKSWAMLSWAAKFLNESGVYSGVVNPQEAIDRKDASIMNGIYQLIEEADILVAHNGKKFDFKRLNYRFAHNGLNPPSPYMVIDTLTESRKMFDLPSHKLEEVAKALNIDTRKIDTNFDLWIRCVHGNVHALEEMEGYNIQDVYLLEDVYMAMRGWIKSHPNMGLYVEANEPICPNCGCIELEYNPKPYTTHVSKFKSFSCLSCGAIGRLRQSTVGKKARKNLAVSVAR